MLPAIVVVLVVQFFYAHALHLLAIGDSFDRIFGHEWCDVKHHAVSHTIKSKGLSVENSVKALIWGHPDLGIKDHQTPMHCADPFTNDSYAQIMICGSTATGPYFHYNEHKYDTKYRIELGLSSYFETFNRLPDRIILCTIQWDIAHQMYDRAKWWSAEIPDILKSFEKDTNARIDDIEELLKIEINRRKSIGDHSYDNYKVDIGLRTSTWRIGRGILTVPFNEVVRRIAGYRRLTLFDLDSDVWSSVDYHRTNDNCANFGLFRDDVGHPITIYSYPSVEKLLGNMYSPFVSTRSSNDSFNVPILKELPVSDSTTYRLMRAACDNDNLNKFFLPISDVGITDAVLPIPGCGPLFFSRVLNGQRLKWFIGEASHQYHKHQVSGAVDAEATKKYESLMKTDLEHMLLPVSETRLVMPSLLESIPTKGVMPLLHNYTQVKAFTVDSLDDPTALEHYVVLTTRVVIQVPSSQALALFKVPPEYVLHRIDRIWLDITSYDTPKLFEDHSVYKFNDDGIVFVTMNLTRHKISNSAFAARGYSTQSILGVDRDRYERVVSQIPLGDAII